MAIIKQWASKEPTREFHTNTMSDEHPETRRFTLARWRANSRRNRAIQRAEIEQVKATPKTDNA